MKRLLGLLCALLFSVPAMSANLPAGYTELEYIQSNGGQYIDTGVVMTDTTGIKIVIDDTSKASPQAGTAAYYIGTMLTGSYMGYFTRNNSAGWAAVWGWNGENVLGYNIQSTHSTVYINYKNDRRYVYNNGTRDYVGVSSLPTLRSGGKSLTLFAIAGNLSYNSAGKIYSVELTEGSEVVHKFVPAQNSSGVIGMYDIMDNNPATAFHTNAGSGTFTGGDPVNPCKNLFNKNDSDVGDGYIAASTGAIVANSGRSHTGYILVKPNTTYHVTLPEYQTGSSNGIAFYTANKTFVSGIASSQSYGREPYNFTVPNDDTIVYARLTITNLIAQTDLDAIQIEEGDHGTSYVPYDTMCWCKNLAEPKFAGRQVTGWNGIKINSAGTYSVQLIRKDDWTPPANSYIGLGSVNPGLDPSQSQSWTIKGGWLISNGTISKTFVRAELPGTHQLLGVSGIDETTFFQHFDVMLVKGSYTASSMPAYEPYNPACFGIKIATTAYNTAKFSSVVTALNNAVDTIKTVVSNTINQATAVANLQSGKQTMPDSTATNGTCPNYKQCLLVEDESGTPHWYVITDPFRDFVTPILANNTAPNSTTYDAGYTQLEYIESDGTQWINTQVYTDTNALQKVDIKYMMLSGNGDWATIIGDHLNHLIFRKQESTQNYQIYMYTNEALGWTNGYVENQIRTLQVSREGDNLIVYSNNESVFNGQVGWKDFTSNSRVYLFASYLSSGNAVYTSKARLYYAKLYGSNGALVRDLVPVRRNSNGVLGMYDKANNQFYGNANTASGAADFTPGPEVLNQDPAIPGMTWTATWTANANSGISAGTLSGEARCNGVAGTESVAATSAQLNSADWDNDGINCWCKVTNMNVGGVNTSLPESVNAVFSRNGSSATVCHTSCVGWCTYYINNSPNLRKALFGQ